MQDRKEAVSIRDIISKVDQRECKVIKAGSSDYLLQFRLNTGWVNMEYGPFSNDEFGKKIPEDQIRYLWIINFNGNEFSESFIALITEIDGEIRQNQKEYDEFRFPPEGLSFNLRISTDSNKFSLFDNNKINEAKDYGVVDYIKEDILKSYQNYIIPLLDKLNSNVGLHNYLEENAEKYFLRQFRSGILSRLVAKALVKAPDYYFCRSVVFDFLPSTIRKCYQPVVDFLDAKYDEETLLNSEDVILSNKYYIPLDSLLQVRLESTELRLTQTKKTLHYLPYAIGLSYIEKAEHPELWMWSQVSDDRIREQLIPSFQLNEKKIENQLEILKALLVRCKANQDLYWQDIENDMIDFACNNPLSYEGEKFKNSSFSEYYALLWKDRFDKAVKK